jgi:hypothetical protein
VRGPAARQDPRNPIPVAQHRHGDRRPSDPYALTPRSPTVPIIDRDASDFDLIAQGAGLIDGRRYPNPMEKLVNA